MRWTIPGRITPLIPERESPQCASNALTNVPFAWPAAGCTTIPFGLLTTKRSASSYRISKGIASGKTSNPTGSGKITSILSPRCRRYFLPKIFPSQETFPCSARRSAAERVSSSIRMERNLSRRSPSSSDSATTQSGSPMRISRLFMAIQPLFILPFQEEQDVYHQKNGPHRHTTICKIKDRREK